jgi:threonine dehydrogenase-like Zn-dependent dehydrogenase
MRQITVVAPGKLEWREVDAPRVEASGEAIIEPVAVANCDLDPAFIRGIVPVQGSFAFGHEGIGRVVDAGDAVTVAKPGDVVAVPFQITCGMCRACVRGATASCSGVEPRMAMYGMAPLARKEWGGLLSDQVRVPYADAMLVPVPAGVDPVAAASISDNLPDAWRTVGPQLEQFPGASVLIIGGGALSVGLYATAIARTFGAEVTYVDADEHRGAIARSLGASVIVAETYPRKVGSHLITVHASADPEGLYCALRSTAGDGVCTSVGIFNPETPMPLFEMYSRNVTFIIGRVSARPAMPRLLGLIASGALRPQLVTTRVVKGDEAPEALLEPFTKLIFVP